MNPVPFEHFKDVKVYGIQIYKNEFYLYSLYLARPKTYAFALERLFSYPTSGLELVLLDRFINSLLFVKYAVKKSFESVINHICQQSSSLNINVDDVLADTRMTPIKKTKKN